MAKAVESLLAAEIDPIRATARSNYMSLFGKQSRFTVLGLQRPGRRQVFFSQMDRLANGLESLVNGKLTKSTHSKSEFPEIARFIIANLDNGRSVQLAFYKVPEMINESTGVGRLDRPLQEVLAKTDDVNHPWTIYAHGALIENYRYNEDGKLVFLVKDSQGEELYDRGYIHMDEDFLHGLMIEVSGYDGR